MITKSDCLILLSEIEDSGVDTADITKEILTNGRPTIGAIKFINDHRELDLTKFYEKLRKSYNDKKSSLYINIMKEIDDPNEVTTTLSSLALQIMLFGNRTAEDKKMFLSHSRIKEIYECLHNYIQTSDLIPCLKLIKLVKADIKALESVSR